MAGVVACGEFGGDDGWWQLRGDAGEGGGDGGGAGVWACTYRRSSRHERPPGRWTPEGAFAGRNDGGDDCCCYHHYRSQPEGHS